MAPIESHAGLRLALRTLCQQFSESYWRELDQQRAYPEAFVRTLTEAGYLGALIPREYGGMLDDSITTDHISPAGNFSQSSPAGTYLLGRGVERRDFNTYGARRGNHEVMVRGTFGNIRLKNRLLPGKEGYYTVHLPDGEQTTMYEASERYKQEGVPLIVIASKEYDSGSSRDWPPRGHCCWVCVPLSLKVSSVSTASTSSAWASSHCSSNRAKTKSRSG